MKSNLLNIYREHLVLKADWVLEMESEENNIVPRETCSTKSRDSWSGEGNKILQGNSGVDKEIFNRGGAILHLQ